jgi:uncharacterized membrane protein (DUF485 family)
MSDDHVPEKENAADVQRNARLGLALFFVYLLLYGGFMGLSAFSLDTMRSTPFGGVNLAILYGFGLIVGAFVLAMVYMVLCKSSSASENK